MLIYTINRILHLIPILFILTIIVFSFVHLLPGDVIDTMVGDEEAEDPETRAILTKEYGLDQPIIVQYGVWLGKVLQGDFGRSILTRRPVADELFSVFPATIYLAITGTVLSFLIAVPLGTLAAVNRNSIIDYFVQLGSISGISVPEYMFAILCILLFSLHLGWLPSSGYVSPFDDFGRSLYYMAMPAFVVAFRHAAHTTRLTRASILDEINKDYVITARSLGFSENRVIFKYTLRNAMIPTLTVSGLQLANALGGTVVIETVFAWPGIGYEIYLSIVSHDFPIVQGGMLMLGTIVVFMNLIVDLLYRALNPTVQLR
jgi:peptide/nickel transport system permease protein